MKEALRKLDRKFLIFIGCLILIPLILIIFLIMAQGCSNRKTAYSKYEFKMKSAAKKYLTKIDEMPTEKGDYIIVNLDTLVEQSYIESPRKALKDETCTGYISARMNNTVNYVSVLKCDNYKTNTIKENILNDLTVEGDGLYETSEGYVFKGLNVNNYFELGDITYRIVSIDKKGILKLYNPENESLQMYWDSKYNVETNANTGLNIYKDSYILEKITKYYNSNNKLKKAKPYLVSTDVCVYSKAKDARFLDKSKCVELLKDQYVTLLSLDDFMNASLDPNCTDLYSKSCKNYNYLGRNGGVYSWTKDIVEGNTYQVYYLTNGIPYTEDANIYNYYNYVVFVDGDQMLTSGNGTKDAPYTIK